MASILRTMRVQARLTNATVHAHPGYFDRFCRLMGLGLTAMNLPTLDVTMVAKPELAGTWLPLASRTSLDTRASAIAANVPYPVRIREGDVPADGPDTRPIIGHIIAGEGRGGDLWGLAVMMAPGETEGSPSFQERCREAAQRLGAEKVQVVS